MCASICKGDWIWSKKDELKNGMAVILKNPLYPEEIIVRRIVGIPGQTVKYGRDGDIIVNSKRIRQVDMGFYNNKRLIQENLWSGETNTTWLTLKQKQAIPHKNSDSITLSDHEYYLLADNRDSAIDSRWWGPVNEQFILGAVFIRFGESNEWRKTFEFGLPIGY